MVYFHKNNKERSRESQIDRPCELKVMSLRLLYLNANGKAQYKELNDIDRLDYHHLEKLVKQINDDSPIGLKISEKLSDNLE